MIYKGDVLVKKFKASLAGVLSLALLLPALSGLSVAAEPDADEQLNAPTVEQFYMPEAPEGMTSSVTGLDGGGVRIKFGKTDNGAYDATKYQAIATAQKVKWDGLHIRVKNFNAYGIVLHFSDEQIVQHSPAKGGKTLCMSISGAGQMQLFDGSWQDAPVVFRPADASKRLEYIDLRLRKTEDGHMEINLNGQTDDMVTCKSALEAAAFPDEVYVSFINGFNEMPGLKCDVTVFHGGEAKCYAGVEDVESVDKDQEFNAPVLDEDTFSAFTPQADGTYKKDADGKYVPAEDSKFAVSALNNGGIKVAANGVKLGDFLISDKAYQFNGLHMRLDVSHGDGVYHAIRLWIGPDREFPWAYASADCKGYYIDINTFGGKIQGISNMFGAVRNVGYDETAMPGLSDDVKTFDIKFGIADAKPLAGGDAVPCYGLFINDFFYGLIEVSAAKAENFDDVYIGFTAVNPQTGDAIKDYALTFSYKMTVLHGGEDTCLDSLPAPALEKVAETEKALQEVADITSVTLADEAKIVAARALYNSLNAAQKKLLNDANLPALEAAEKTIADLKAQSGEADQQAAQAVMDLISAIPASVTLADEAKIVAAEEAYAALTDTQKSKVTNFMDLTFARMALDALKEGAGSEPDVPTGPVETGASTLPVVVCAVLVVLAAGMLVVSKKKAHA